MNKKYALLSVSDKSGIVDFAKGLIGLGYEILSTGGTLKLLVDSGISASDVATYTKSSEMFDGRVKTLHPKIHGGILYRRDNANDVAMAKANDIQSIDLVCANLYPFKQCIEKFSDFNPSNFDEIIENIDIGGPSMIRAAAKNFKSVVVVVGGYKEVLDTLQNDGNTLEFRQKLMIKAYEHSAQYDCMIANYMNERFNDGLGDMHFVYGKKVLNTKYGENPHQKGALYEFESYFSKHFIALKGEVSFNNLTDINSALNIASSFEESCVCIVKHGNPCGFALRENLVDAYKEALKCDSLSAYGGVVAINGVVDINLAKEINKMFIEVLICGDISQDALDEFANKKKIKIFVNKSKKLVCQKDKMDFKHINGGFVLQNSDFIKKDEVRDARQMGKYALDKERFIDLEIAYKISAFTKSNCVAYVKDRALVGIGMGMTSRVDASKAAISKAKDMGIDMDGCVFASEAFLPFKDSVDMAKSCGAKAIIQPGGSIRDEEVIQACDDAKIAIYFTNTRHFLH